MSKVPIELSPPPPPPRENGGGGGEIAQLILKIIHWKI